MSVPTPDPAVEPTEDTLRVVEFAPTDALLREDVKIVGALVGEILAEQRGAGVPGRSRTAATRRHPPP